MSIFVFIISCKLTRTAVSCSESSRETNIANDISLTDDAHISELTDQIIKNLFNEHLNIDIRQTKYDTGKSIIGETGMFPVFEEIEININRETKTHKTDSIRRKTDSTLSIELKDNSGINEKIKIETKETRMKKWRNILTTIGLSVISGILLSLYLKK